MKMWTQEVLCVLNLKLLVSRSVPPSMCIKTFKLNHAFRCAREAIIETNAGGRQLWGWDGDWEPRRYSLPWMPFVPPPPPHSPTPKKPHSHSSLKLSGPFVLRVCGFLCMVMLCIYLNKWPQSRMTIFPFLRYLFPFLLWSPCFMHSYRQRLYSN